MKKLFFLLTILTLGLGFNMSAMAMGEKDSADGAAVPCNEERDAQNEVPVQDNADQPSSAAATSDSGEEE